MTLQGSILVLNAGSSSVKFRLFDADTLREQASGEVNGIGGKPVFAAKIDGASQQTSEPQLHDQEDALHHILRCLSQSGKSSAIHAVGHRVVHGGSIFTQPVRVDDRVLQQLETLIPLAPLHQPHNIASIRICTSLLPHIPQIACFDTAFHAGRGEESMRFALPRTWFESGVKRYGFHGLSYEWVAQRLREDQPELAKGRVVAAHLGSGASLCAMQAGRSIDTTMGMTALDGLPMGTRCGELDPGVVLYLVRDRKMSVEAVEKLIYEESGLKGLSGISGDARELAEREEASAAFALDYFAYKTAQHIAGMIVSLGGIDAIVFTGGIGEHMASVREAILSRLRFLGDIHALVIEANEERVVAQHVLALVEQNIPVQKESL